MISSDAGVSFILEYPGIISPFPGAAPAVLRVNVAAGSQLPFTKAKAVPALSYKFHFSINTDKTVP
jgi:hypothetical protein